MEDLGCPKIYENKESYISINNMETRKVTCYIRCFYVTKSQRLLNTLVVTQTICHIYNKAVIRDLDSSHEASDLLVSIFSDQSLNVTSLLSYFFGQP